MAIESTYTNVREHFAEYLDKAVQDREVIIVHRKNNGDAAIIAADDLRSLQETAYLLGSPYNAARLLSALEGARAGEGIAFASVEALGHHLGSDVPVEEA